MKDSTAIAITGIVSVTVLEGLAIYFSIDGSILFTVVAAVAGIVGYAFGRGLNAPRTDKT